MLGKRIRVGKMGSGWGVCRDLGPRQLRWIRGRWRAWRAVEGMRYLCLYRLEGRVRGKRQKIFRRGRAVVGGAIDHQPWMTASWNRGKFLGAILMTLGVGKGCRKKCIIWG